MFKVKDRLSISDSTAKESTIKHPLRLLLLFLLTASIFFSDSDRRIRTACLLAGPGMLSLVSQSVNRNLPDTAYFPENTSQKNISRNNPSQNTAFQDSSFQNHPFLRNISEAKSDTESPRIALTFDDGPNPIYTPKLLQGLRDRNIHASFFLLGENIEGNEDILKQMKQDGHLIGNHTWDHVQLNKIPVQKARLEIEKTNNRIYEVTGIYPSYVRPPFGAWIKNMELSVAMFPVFWDVDTLDWQSQNINSILSIAEKEVRDGSIILMHDGYQTSVDAALKIADIFTQKGYIFVTADQLLVT